jgi:adenine-specific DNA-methyltransferase
MAKKPATPKTIEALRHKEAKRKNIPTAEHQSVIEREQEAPRVVKYPRNTDLDPQLVWRGKDEKDWSDLVVHAPPLYIQEKVHPKVLIDDLLTKTKETKSQAPGSQIDLFADFNGMPQSAEKTEFYAHDQNWSNRMILGDSLQVMASLAEREGLRGKVYGNIRHGFVYERVPHITLKSIANNAEIDVIWDQWQEKLNPLHEKLNAALKKTWQEWEIPREADAKWPDTTKKLHADWWQARIARQQEIDKSIVAKAEFEYLYDKPYDDKKTVRVAGPFTVESLSPHRVLGVDENDDLIDPVKEGTGEYCAKQTFPQMILENLKIAGVQQAHKEDRITFIALTPWPGALVCAEGRYMEGETEKRAAIIIGPEFGTVQRADLVEAAREAGDAGFDVLIACAFNYDAHATDFNKLGRISVLKARMNADLHMAEDLKNTGKGNLFVIFGEPDITLLPEPDGKMRVKVNGVDVFHPQTGEVRSDGADGIACWFIDTDYNGESFFVRHAYFLGASDPYSALKTTLKAEINEDAWATLHSDTSRPFEKPKQGRIAVKVINHLGDEVMKVFRV